MEKLKVSQVAAELGITATAVYRKFKTCSEQVQNEITREKGVTYLSRHGLDILKATIQKPVPEVVSHGSEPVQNLEKQVASQQEIITGLQKTIDRLIAQQGEERSRSDTIIMKLSNDVQAMQKALEFKPEDRMVPAAHETPRADPPRFVPPPAEKKPVQRDTVSAWEGIRLAFDDIFGFAFGRG